MHISCYHFNAQGVRFDSHIMSSRSRLLAYLGAKQGEIIINSDYEENTKRMKFDEENNIGKY